MKKIRRTVLVLLACILFASNAAQPAYAWGWGDWQWDLSGQTHGTTDREIAEYELKENPPVGYMINKEVQGDAMDGEYNAYFLEDSIQTVKIEINETNLNYMLQNAVDEPYVMTTSVTIGDVKLGYCGIKTKGNYTLYHGYHDNPFSDRFSFTVNFGKYITKADYGKKQNFFGCDKISFNNFFFDKTMMKEFFALRLLNEMGLPAPQCGLAKLYINGEYYGVYAMIEALDESILEQYYGVDGDDLSNYLCKPTGTNLLYEDIEYDASPLWEYDEETYKDVEDMIPTAIEWVRRLNCLSEGTDFEGNAIDVNSQEYLDLLAQVMEVDECVRYFATHSWLCQTDNMFTCKQNFGLYISEDGVCTLVPWDYDLSFGCYSPSTAQATANYPVDIMYQMGRMQDPKDEEPSRKVYSQFPLFNVIYQNDALMEQYHSYMKDCSKIAALGGTVEATGKSYAPGYFNSFIEAMETELVAAASEQLADNVYYMNFINQPNDVKRGLPNLAKIIAMRAVAVYNQVEGIDAVVTASGCNLETLGNAQRGDVAKDGVLTAIDSATGIFVTAEYEEGRIGSAPMLTVNVLNEGHTAYNEVIGKIEPEENETVLVYDVFNSASPCTDYRLTVPVDPAYLADGMECRIYSYMDGTLRYLDADVEGNLHTVTLESFDKIVVFVTPETHLAEIVVIGTASIAVFGSLIGMFVGIRKNRTAKKKTAE